MKKVSVLFAILVLGFGVLVADDLAFAKIKFVDIESIAKPAEPADTAWVLGQLERSAAKLVVQADQVPPLPRLPAPSPIVVIVHEIVEYPSPNPIGTAFRAYAITTGVVREGSMVAPRLRLPDRSFVPLRPFVTLYDLGPGTGFLFWDSTSIGSQLLPVAAVEVNIFDPKEVTLTQSEGLVRSIGSRGGPNLQSVERVPNSRTFVIRGTFDTRAPLKILFGGIQLGDVQVFPDLISVRLPDFFFQDGSWDVTVEQYNISNTVSFYFSDSPGKG